MIMKSKSLWMDANHLTLTFLFQSGSVESREEINLKRTETRPS